jgi:UDP-4-amino-4-deoxy-L-arabinose formyltransferase/UDP-glucuronic acid dehydrogenase (UDP-4-keto-hexauronic acid decarboxylating)
MEQVLFIGDTRFGRPILQAIQKKATVRLTGIITERAAIQQAGLLEGTPVFGIEQIRTPDAAAWIREQDPTVIINFNSLHLLSREIIEIPEKGAYNFHPGPLPEYAGLFVYQWGIINGETEFGTTIHRMDAGIDSGDIVIQKRFPIDPADTGMTLYMKCIREGISLFTDLLDLFERGEKPPALHQDPALRRYYDKTPPYSGVINFAWKAGDVHNFIRALSYRPFISPSTCPHTFLHRSRIEVVRSRLFTAGKSGTPGQVITVNDDGITVRCQDDAICIERVFHAGASVPASEYASLAGILPGVILGR